jgi:mTERF domain-containing protein
VDVKLEPAYIACRPAMLSYSLQVQLKPRHYVLKFLKARGLVNVDRDYYAALNISN